MDVPFVVIFSDVISLLVPYLHTRRAPSKTEVKETPSFLQEHVAPKKTAASPFPWEQPAKARTSVPVVPPINTAIGINSSVSRTDLAAVASTKVAAAFPWENKVDLVKPKQAPRPRIEDEDDGLESIAV